MIQRTTLLRLTLASTLISGGLVLAHGCGNGGTTDPLDMGTDGPSADMTMVAPAPTLTGIDQTKGFTKGGLVVKLTGTNFKPGATVKFGTVSADPSTVSVSADGTQITVTTPANLGKPGVVIVTVMNPDSQVTATPVMFRYYVETVAFAAPVVVAGTSNGPRAIATADFDADGDIDLATADADGARVTVFINDGSGTFAAKGPSAAVTNYTVGTYPYSVIAGDVNGDGAPDLVVVNQQSNNLHVLTNKKDGSGTFTVSAGFAIPNAGATNQAQWAAISDVNKDGKVDLVVSLNSAIATASNLGVLLAGNTAGVYNGTITNIDLDRESVVAVVGADVNGDGAGDVVALHNVMLANKPVTMLLHRNGTATPYFTTANFAASGANAFFAAAADFDNDQKLDLAIANQGSNSVGILKGNGQGGFTEPATATATGTTGPESVATGDIDGDGNVDVVSANYNGALATTAGDLSLLLGNGDGTLKTRPATNPFNLTAATRKPNFVVIADFDKDGRLDVACTDYRATGGALLVLRNTSQ